MNQRVIANNFEDVWECAEWLDGLVGNLADTDEPEGETISSIAHFQIITRHARLVDDYFIIAVVNTEMLARHAGKEA